MTQQAETIRFHNPTAFTGLTGTIDFNNCIIHGVSLIQPFVEAEGHGLWVDDVTATQLFEAAKIKGKTPVNMDHGSGITSMNGTIRNVRMDNGRPRGDWHLLKSHKDTMTMLERASEMSECFGLSAAFRGDPKGVLFKGKQCARVEKLLSFDVVCRPAANESLFSAKDTQNVDSRNNHQRSKNIELQNTMPAEPTLQDVLAQLQSMQQTIAQQGEMQQSIIGHINQGVTGAPEAGEVDPAFLSALNDASDEELAAYNEQNGTDISREDINGAVSEYNAGLSANQGEEQGEQGQEGDGQYEGSYGSEQSQGETAGASAGGSEGGAGGATSFAAMQREIVQLKARLNKRDNQEIQFAEQQATNDVRTKISAIVSQRDQLVQFADRVVAENEALRVHVKTGTRPVAAGVDDGIRLFGANDDGALHPFQQRIVALKAQHKCTDGQAILFAMKEPNGAALHADWNQSKGRQTIRA